MIKINFKPTTSFEFWINGALCGMLIFLIIFITINRGNLYHVASQKLVDVMPKSYSKESVVVFSDASVLKLLETLYIVNPYEYSVCLLGSISNDTSNNITRHVYSIQKLVASNTVQANETAVVNYIDCPEATIIKMHKHPGDNDGNYTFYPYFTPSHADIDGFKYNLEKDYYHSDTLMGIQYGPNRFAFYSYGNYDEFIKWEAG